MSARKTLLSAIVFLALLALYLVDARHIAHQKATEEKSERLITFTIANIQKVDLHNDNGNFLLDRDKEGKWRIEKPLQTAADPDQVEPMLRNIQGAKKRNVFKPEGDLSQYGLKNPKVWIALTGMEDGKTKTVKILYGATAAQTYQVYGQIAGQKDVFILSDYSKKQCEKTLFDLRDKTVIAAAPEDITSLDIAMKGKTIQLHRTSAASKLWLVGQPGAAADSDTVENLLSTIHNTRATDIFDSPTSTPAYFHLTPALARATLTVVSTTAETATTPNSTKKTPAKTPTKTAEATKAAAGAKTTKQILYLGKNHPMGGGIYAKLQGDPRVFVVRASFLTDLNKTPNDLRDKRLLNVAQDDVSTIEIRSNRQTVEITRPSADAKWAFTDGKTPRVSQQKANTLLSDLVGLKAKEFLAEASDVTPAKKKKWELNSPSAGVRIRTFDSPTTKGFDRGKIDVDKEIVYIRRLSDGAILGLDFKRVGDFYKFREDLEDRSFLHFNTANVDELRVEAQSNRGPLTYDFKRRTSSWATKTADGRRVTVRPYDVTSFLDDLSGLEYASLFTPSPEDKTQGGLAAPKAKITALDKDGHPLAWLAYGNREGFRQVMESGKGMYLVDLTNTDRLTRGLQTLLKKVEQSPNENLFGGKNPSKAKEGPPSKD